MKKHIEESPTLLEKIMHSPLGKKCYEKRKTLFALFLALLICIIGGTLWQQTRVKKRLLHYKKAVSISHKLHTSKELTASDKEKVSHSDLAKELEEMAQSYTEIKKRYAGLLAQEGLIHGENGEKKTLAETSLDELRLHDLHKYADFSTLSLLIGGEKYEDAYTLCSKMTEKTFSSSENMLYGLLLLYKATLEKELNKENEMQKTIADIRHLLEIDDAHRALFNHLQDQNFSLLSFLEQKGN